MHQTFPRIRKTQCVILRCRNTERVALGMLAPGMVTAIPYKSSFGASAAIAGSEQITTRASDLESSCSILSWFGSVDYDSLGKALVRLAQGPPSTCRRNW